MHHKNNMFILIFFFTLIAALPSAVIAADVVYTADNTPEQAGWSGSGGGSVSVSSGILDVNKPANTHYYFNKNVPELDNSIGTTFEARVKIVFGGMTSGYLSEHGTEHAYGAYFDIRDGTRLGGVAIGDNKIEFGKQFFAMDTKSDFHVYRLTLRGDSMLLYIDGNFVATEKASTASGSVITAAVSTSSWTGNGESLWDYIAYTSTGAYPANSYSFPGLPVIIKNILITPIAVETTASTTSTTTTTIALTTPAFPVNEITPKSCPIYITNPCSASEVYDDKTCSCVKKPELDMIEYSGDLLPAKSTPAWTDIAATWANSVSDGVLKIAGPPGEMNGYKLKLEITPYDDFTIEARLKIEEADPVYGLLLEFWDGKKNEGLILHKDRIRLMMGKTEYRMDTTSYHTYRIEFTQRDKKTRVFVDGKEVLSGTGVYYTDAYKGIAIGHIVTNVGTSKSYWDYVKFWYGASETPPEKEKDGFVSTGTFCSDKEPSALIYAPYTASTSAFRADYYVNSVPMDYTGQACDSPTPSTGLYTYNFKVAVGSGVEKTTHQYRGQVCLPTSCKEYISSFKKSKTLELPEGKYMLSLSAFVNDIAARSQIDSAAEIYTANRLPGKEGWNIVGGVDSLSVNGGILYYNGPAGIHYLSRDIAADNSIGTTVEANMRGIPKSPLAAIIDVADGKGYIEMELKPSWIVFGGQQYDFDARDSFNTYRITLKGNVATLYLNGKYFATATPIETNENEVIFGKSTKESSAAANSQWEYIDYTTSGAYSPDDYSFPQISYTHTIEVSADYPVIYPQITEHISIPSEKISLDSWTDPYDINTHTSTGGCGANSCNSNEQKETSPSIKIASSNKYTLDTYIFYRVLVKPDGSEEIIDQYKYNNHISTRSEPVQGQTGVNRYFAEYTLPEKILELKGAGDYTVEVRRIRIPALTAEKNPNIGIDSVVNLYDAELINNHTFETGWEKFPGQERSWNHDYYMCTKTPASIFSSTGSLDLTKVTDNACVNLNMFQVNESYCKFPYQSYRYLHTSYQSLVYNDYYDLIQDWKYQSCWLELLTNKSISTKSLGENIAAYVYSANDGGVDVAPAYEYRKLAVGDRFSITLSNGWKIEKLDTNYISATHEGGLCTDSIPPVCSIPYEFKALKEGNTKIVLSSVGAGIIEIKVVELDIEGSPAAFPFVLDAGHGNGTSGATGDSTSNTGTAPLAFVITLAAGAGGIYAVSRGALAGKKLFGDDTLGTGERRKVPLEIKIDDSKRKPAHVIYTGDGEVRLRGEFLAKNGIQVWNANENTYVSPLLTLPFAENANDMLPPHSKPTYQPAPPIKTVPGGNWGMKGAAPVQRPPETKASKATAAIVNSAKIALGLTGSAKTFGPNKIVNAAILGSFAGIQNNTNKKLITMKDKIINGVGSLFGKIGGMFGNIKNPEEFMDKNGPYIALGPSGIGFKAARSLTQLFENKASGIPILGKIAGGLRAVGDFGYGFGKSLYNTAKGLVYDLPKAVYNWATTSKDHWGDIKNAGKFIANGVSWMAIHPAETGGMIKNLAQQAWNYCTGSFMNAGECTGEIAQLFVGGGTVGTVSKIGKVAKVVEGVETITKAERALNVAGKAGGIARKTETATTVIKTIKVNYGKRIGEIVEGIAKNSKYNNPEKLENLAKKIQALTKSDEAGASMELRKLREAIKNGDEIYDINMRGKITKNIIDIDRLGKEAKGAKYAAEVKSVTPQMMQDAKSWKNWIRKDILDTGRKLSDAKKEIPELRDITKLKFELPTDSLKARLPDGTSFEKLLKEELKKSLKMDKPDFEVVLNGKVVTAESGLSPAAEANLWRALFPMEKSSEITKIEKVTSSISRIEKPTGKISNLGKTIEAEELTKLSSYKKATLSAEKIEKTFNQEYRKALLKEFPDMKKTKLKVEDITEKFVGHITQKMPLASTRDVEGLWQKFGGRITDITVYRKRVQGLVKNGLDGVPELTKTESTKWIVQHELMHQASKESDIFWQKYWRLLFNEKAPSAQVRAEILKDTYMGEVIADIATVDRYPKYKKFADVRYGRDFNKVVNDFKDTFKGRNTVLG